MNVLIAGGGTGGHLFPGIALAQELVRRRPETRVTFVGTERGIETRAVPRAGFELELLPVRGLRRTGIYGMVRGLLRLPASMWQAFRLVRRLAPDVAVSVGGYAAGPAVLSAKMLGVPSVVMEQNAVPGFTNRILGRFVDRVFASLPTVGFPPAKVSVLGNPVRSDLIEVRAVAYRDHNPLRVLVFGGSQGARALNDVLVEMAPKLRDRRWHIVHQTGPRDEARVQAAYDAAEVRPHVHAFIDDMAVAYRDADLVVCRAGASTIAELTVCGRPSILVPYPYAVDDHQTENAKVVERAGGAIHLPQTRLSANALFEELDRLDRERETLRGMARASHREGRPEAVVEIADALEGFQRV